MKIEITYPSFRKQRGARNEAIRILKWPFLFAAYLCPILNLFTGGNAWSIIVVWSIWMVWSNAVAPSLVEYNLISQLIKLIAQSCILLLLIDVLLTPGFAIEVVPIVCFCGLTLSGILFFSDMERQQQNMMPMLMLCGVSLVCSVFGLLLWWHRENAWALLVLGAFALALLIACFLQMGSAFLRNLKKYFATN